MRILKMPLIASVCTLFLLSVLSIWSPSFLRDTSGMLQVTFLDVGQGDAIFIESPSGTQILIDGGKGNMVLGRLQTVLGFFDRDIDMVIATHPDTDHIGGLIDVLDYYTVQTILITENESETPAFRAFKERVESEGGDVIYARKGQVYDLGLGPKGSTTLNILFPDRNPVDWESNTASIVGQLVYGTSEFLLTGDAPEEIEEYVVHTYGTQLESDVLKAGHHGSRTSTGELLVSVVQPTYAVISAGQDNSYGHPHLEVIERLTSYGAAMVSTAESGSITFVSDGVTTVLQE